MLSIAPAGSFSQENRTDDKKFTYFHPFSLEDAIFIYKIYAHMFTNEHVRKQATIEAVEKIAYERQAYKPDTKMIAKRKLATDTAQYKFLCKG